MGTDHLHRSIFILPQFANGRHIESLRSQYDPLFGKVPPHITLVHPFHSTLSTDELRQHVKACVGAQLPFPLYMKGIVGAEDGYLFLTVQQGTDPIIALHDALYTGPLRPFLHPSIRYLPHITIGRIENPTVHERVLASLGNWPYEFTAEVTAVDVESIDHQDCSHIEFSVPLGAGPV